MKLLLIYADSFSYRTTIKTIESEPDLDEERRIDGALVGFIHLEESDEDDPTGIETKLVKVLKWAARKNGTDRIVLHSFAHLAESKASPEFARSILNGAQKRLIDSGYEATQTPFGYSSTFRYPPPDAPRRGSLSRSDRPDRRLPVGEPSDILQSQARFGSGIRGGGGSGGDRRDPEGGHVSLGAAHPARP